MRSRVDSLSEDRFCDIRLALGYDLWVMDETVVECWLDGGGGQRHLPRDSWRDVLTEEMLTWKEDNKSQWNRLCSITRIETDSALALRYAVYACLIAGAALVISVASIVVSVRKAQS